MSLHKTEMTSEPERQNDQEQKTYPLTLVRGLPFPSLFLMINDVENTIDFKPEDTDIFVVTYPKCGTTWMQFIIWEILHKGAVPPSPNQMMFQHFPFLEVTGVEMLKYMSPPRTMKTHLPFNLQPYNPKAKYVYIVRNPWDCCVSYYYHLQNDPFEPQMTFDEYFELFIRGQVGWGGYFDHVLSWFEHRNDPNVLFLTYENMKKDKKKNILGIAKFLGDTFYEDMSNDGVMENCLKYTDFTYMKEMGMFFPKIEEGVTSANVKELQEVMNSMSKVDRKLAHQYGCHEVNFFRKGEVGDWKNHFSPAHIKKFNKYMLNKLKNTEMEDFWQPLMEETSL